MRILIVKLSSLGDVLHTLPAAQALRAAYPDAHLGWAIEKAHAPLVRGQPWLDETIEWDRQRGSLLDFVRRLRQGRWDIAIDLQNLFRSGLVTRLSGARRRVGVSPSRELAHWFYNDPVRLSSTEQHAVDRSLEIVAHLGAHYPGLPLDRPYVEGRVPREDRHARELFPLQPTQDDVAAADRWCATNGFDAARERLVILNPHCRREANLWPVAQFAELARRLLQRPDVKVALCGGPVATPLADEIEARSGQRLLRADGQLSLLGSAELFARAAVLVTGDTGPMHIAAAVGVPIVALLGATAPLRTGPYSSSAVVIHKRLPCSPCLAKRCPLKQDPPACMQQISVDEVLAAVTARLDEASQDWTQRKVA